jgi:pimeloyl-ACP methyl ester carboxylesterase
MPPVGEAVVRSPRSFTGPFNVPILLIFAEQAKAAAKKETDSYVAMWRRMVPAAKVVVITNADHFVFVSNKDEVLRDVNAFIGALPRT